MDYAHKTEKQDKQNICLMNGTNSLQQHSASTS